MSWSVTRIRSPWLRLPVAWVIALGMIIILGVAVVVVVIQGAVRGAVEELRDQWDFIKRDLDLRQAWMVLTTWRLDDVD